MKNGIIPSELQFCFFEKVRRNCFVIKSFLLFSIIILTSTTNAFATHISGADMSYKWISGNTFELTLTLYRDCSGIAAPNSVSINYRSASCGYNLNTTLTKVASTGQEITQPCDSASTTCTGGSNPGIQQYEYKGNITLPAQCTDWIFGYSICCRNCAITTLSYTPNNCSGVPATYVEATLNNLVSPTNSSPIFTNVPVSFFCIGQPFHYNHGAYDAEGDSLVYSFVDPRSAATTNVVFSAGYSSSNPISSSPPISLGVNGDMLINPTAVEVGVMAILVKEYRNGDLIGTVVRDMQVWTYPCSNNLPTASGINGTNNFSIVACPGNTLSFNINSADFDISQSVVMDWNYGIPGGSFTSSSSTRPVGTFTWTPTIANVRSNPYTFTITVMDNSCPTNGFQTYSYNVTVKNISASATSTNSNCASPGTGSAFVIPSGQAPFQYSWSPGGAITSSITGLVTGIYTATITDANGCIATDTASVNSPTPVNSTLLGSANASCFGYNNGSASVSAFGGVSPYTYTWSPSGGTSPFAIGLTAGSYTVTISDSHGCTHTMSTVITHPSVLTATTNSTPLLCNNDGSGVAWVIPSGGTTGYNFSWTTGATTSTINGLATGNYSVIVTDAHGCTISSSVNVAQPTILNSSLISSTPVSCYGGNNGSGNITANGGSGPYNFSWSPSGGNLSSASGLAAGNYNVTVTDAHNCVSTTSINIVQPPVLLSSIASFGNALCYGDSSGYATVTQSGGTPPYSYTWTPNSDNSPSATGLRAGNYSVTITDVNGCNSASTITISEPSPIAMNLVSSVDVSCFGSSDGSAVVTTTGGTSAYTYQWSSSAVTGPSENNLSSGNYNVEVTDVNNCKDTISIAINQPAVLSSSVSSTNTKCFGSMDGFAAATPSGGTGPYTFLWSPGNSTANLYTGLSSGNYDVTITDSKGCTYTSSAIINQPTDLNLSVTTINSTCGNSNGKAIVDVTGGTAGYNYSWSPGSSSNNSLNNISAGSYTVTVTDANGCTSTAMAGVSNNGAPGIAVTSLSPVSCEGGFNGSASINATGGFAPFRYLWSPVGGAGSVATGLSAGSYSVTVTNRHNCSSVLVVDIPEPTQLQINSTMSPVTCFGGNDGSVSINVNGGTGSYDYVWNSGIGNNPSGNSLTSGNYTVTVSDNNNCTATSTVTVTEPPSLNAVADAITPASCFGGSDGTANLNVNGGTSPYSFNWTTTGNTAQSASGLIEGNYPVTITDASGCTTTTTIIINEPPQLDPQTSTIAGTCNLSNASASVNASGGIPPYSYFWNQTGDTSTSISGLAPGNYFVTITDANGCSSSTFANVVNAGMISANIASVTHVSCNGGNDGAALVNVTGGTPPYGCNWQPTGGDAPFADSLPAGNFSVLVTDANNCSLNIPVTITDPPAISSTVFTTNIKCAGDGNGIASVSAAGGTGAFSYQWLPGGQSTPTIGSLNGGNYTVIITDANGCTSSIPIIIIEPAPINLATNSTQAGCNLSNGTATAIANGGTPPFNYLWTPGGHQTNIATGISAGSYQITVTDANNCISTASAGVSNPTGPTASLINSSQVKCAGGNDGTAEINVAGGVAPFDYNWTPMGGATSIATNLSAGSYSVTVRDSNNCFAAVPITISEPSSVNSVITPSSTSCFGGANGSASAVTNGGTPPYDFLWSNGETTPTAFGLQAGLYTLVVTDANGCPFTFNTTINEPPSINLDLETAPVICNGQNSGYASVIPTGGTPGYTYLWSNGYTYPSGTNFFAGNFIVTITDAHGCTKDTSINIGEPPKLIVNAIPTYISCSYLRDGSARVDVTGGVPPYTYEWTPNGGTADSTFNLGIGSHAIKVRDGNGCLTKNDFYIDAPRPLALTPSVTAVKCYGGNNGTVRVSVLGGTPPYSYLWNSGSTTFLDDNLQAGTYTVTVTDSNSCTSQASGYITQPTPLDLTIDTQRPICIGENIMLNAQCSGGTPGYLYIWNDGSHYSQVPVSPVTTTTYFVTVIDAHSCPSGLATITISVHPPLLAAITGPDTICEGNFATLLAQGSGGSEPYNYSWNNGATGNYNTVAPTTNTIYSVTVSDHCGTPPVTISVPVIVSPNPVVNFTPNPIEGCQPLLVNFQDQTDLESNEFYWNFGDGNSDTSRSPSHIFLNPGSYTINHLATTIHGCKGRIVVPDAVKVYPLPISEFSNIPEVASIFNPVISFTDASTNAVRWEWDFGDNSGSTLIRNTEHTYRDTGTFTVRLITTCDHGCVDTAYGKAFIKGEFAFYIPNAFTPNNDGVNDTFFALGIGVKEYEMYIYDRWGLNIFTSNDLNKGWDGRVQGDGSLCQMDVYLYKINVTDLVGKTHNYVGRVSLVR